MMFRVTYRCVSAMCIASWLAACGSDDGSTPGPTPEDAKADHVDASSSDSQRESAPGSDVVNEPVDGSSGDASTEDRSSDSASADADAVDERGADAAPDGGTADARDASGDGFEASVADVSVDSASTDATDVGSIDAGTDAGSIDAGSDATSPDDASGDGEAGVDPFACLGAPLPTTAPATVNLQGVVDNANGAAVAGATVEGFIGSSASAAASATSAADGSFAFDLASGGVPLDAYLHATATGFFDTYHYPAYPITFSPIAFTVLLIDAGTLAAFSGLTGMTQDSSKGFMLIVVDDCGTGNVAGATIGVAPAGSVFYLRNRLPSPAATSTDSSGAGVVFNVPAGQVTVSASVGAMTLRSHVVTVRANTLTRTSIRP